jgi:hypothetical protein
MLIALVRLALLFEMQDFCVDLFVHIFFLTLAFDHVAKIEFDSAPKISSDLCLDTPFNFCILEA